jgi:hypothetical protein
VASYAQLGDVHTNYEDAGRGEPLVLPAPGGADSRVFESNLPGLTAGHVAGRGARPRLPTPTSPANEKWSMPSSPPPAAATSTRTPALDD